MMQIASMQQTSFAFPSQWVGTLHDGRMFCVDYIYGELVIKRSYQPTHDPIDALEGVEIFREVLGTKFDGLIYEIDLINILVHYDMIYIGPTREFFLKLLTPLILWYENRKTQKALKKIVKYMEDQGFSDVLSMLKENNSEKEEVEDKDENKD